MKIKNKRINIRIDPITQQLINSLCSRYNYTTTELIKKAVMSFAASNKHYITIGFFNKDNENIEEKKDENSDW